MRCRASRCRDGPGRAVRIGQDDHWKVRCGDQVARQDDLLPSPSQGVPKGRLAAVKTEAMFAENGEHRSRSR
jgi:hypothetical protein